MRGQDHGTQSTRSTTYQRTAQSQSQCLTCRTGPLVCAQPRCAAPGLGSQLQCPTGISDVYWDTLAAAERRWSAPVHKQLDQADRRKFSERVVKTTGRFAKPTMTMSMHAIGPTIDPGAHSEPALLRLLPQVEQTAKPVVVADDSAGNGKVLPFPSGLSRWKEAGNW